MGSAAGVNVDSFPRCGVVFPFVHLLSQVHRRQKQLGVESRKATSSRRRVVGVGGTQEEQGREWLAL